MANEVRPTFHDINHGHACNPIAALLECRAGTYAYRAAKTVSYELEYVRILLYEDRAQPRAIDYSRFAFGAQLILGKLSHPQYLSVQMFSDRRYV